MGEKSFGAGAAQKTIALKSGALIILSTAKYCTPSGKIIQDETPAKTGIMPDVQAPDEDKRQDLALDAYSPDEQDRDDVAKYRELQEKIEKIQLDKALEILSKGKAPLKKAA